MSLEERVAQMTTGSRPARRALLALAGLLALSLAFAPTGAGAKTVTAKLRVLTPTRVLDPGTTYVVGKERVKTDPAADCLGSGGTGAAFEIARPTGLGLLAAGAGARGSLRPLSLSDGSGFGIAVCGIGSAKAGPGTFWYFKRNHTELGVGVDQERIRDGDELLAYLAPDNFPAPNPRELELRAPARALAGEPFEVTVVEHGCVTEASPPFTTTCESNPAAGATVQGGGETATTDASGRATISLPGSGTRNLRATRSPEIPSEALSVCVTEELARCAAVRGERIVGRGVRDRIKATKGSDTVRGRGGPDTIDIRRGGGDSVDCGPGRDVVLVKRSDRDDRIARSCERIRRR
jgi:hypothetical protein